MEHDMGSDITSKTGIKCTLLPIHAKLNNDHTVDST